MGFRDGAYATIWGVEQRERSCVADLSTSRKDKATNEYRTDFSSKYVSFVGDADKKAKAIGLKRGDRIKIESCEVTTGRGANDKFYTNFTVWEFSPADGKNDNSDGETAGSVNTPAEELPY